MPYVVHMMSYILWLCYHTYNGGCMIDNLVWWQRYSGCAVRYNQCEVRYNSFDVMSRVLRCHKSWVRCHIQCILCHIYSRCDVINRVCVIPLIQWVWSHRHRHEECDVIYSGCIVLTQCVSFLFFLFYFICFICGGFCHTLKWNSHGFTCVPHPDHPSHLPLHPLPLGFSSAPGPSACLMHPTWAGDLFHPR